MLFRLLLAFCECVKILICKNEANCSFEVF